MLYNVPTFENLQLHLYIYHLLSYVLIVYRFLSQRKFFFWLLSVLWISLLFYYCYFKLLHLETSLLYFLLSRSFCTCQVKPVVQFRLCVKFCDVNRFWNFHAKIVEWFSLICILCIIIFSPSMVSFTIMHFHDHAVIRWCRHSFVNDIRIVVRYKKKN